MKLVSTSQRELNKLNELQRQKVTAKEVEIKNLEKLFDKQVRDVRSQNETRLFEVKDAGNRQMVKELKVQEEKLLQYRDNVDKTAKQLEEQRQGLITHQAEQLESIDRSFQENIAAKIDSTKEQSESINKNAGHHLRKLATETDETIKQQEFDSKLKLQDYTTRKEAHLKSRKQEYQLQERDTELKHLNKIAEGELTHKKDLHRQTLKNTIEMNSRERDHMKVMETKEEHYSKLIKGKHDAFTQKFAALKEQHEDVLKKTQTQFSEEIASMVKGHAKAKEELAAKQTDKFYQVTDIKPKIEDKVTHYMLTLNVPPHERDGVRVSANDRTIRVNLTRSFDDTYTDDTGAINKSKRSEVFSKEIKVAELVDRNKIEQSYENGTVSFKISKA